jgi:hypothetical protein
MERDPVDSTSLASVGYDPSRAILEVQFRDSGDVYAYLDVPEATYRALLAAESLGRYFNREVRGRYEFRRVTG